MTKDQDSRLECLEIALRGMRSEDVKLAVAVCRKAIRNLQDEAQGIASSQFRVGQAVQFQSKKRFGQVIKGKIESINTKSVSLAVEGGGRWRVSPSLLTACN